MTVVELFIVTSLRSRARPLPRLRLGGVSSSSSSGARNALESNDRESILSTSSSSSSSHPCFFLPQSFFALHAGFAHCSSLAQPHGCSEYNQYLKSVRCYSLGFEIWASSYLADLPFALAFYS